MKLKSMLLVGAAIAAILNCVCASSVNFALLGDWGLPCQNQSLIAQQMGIWAELNEANFVVALGDNFYC